VIKDLTETELEHIAKCSAIVGMHADQPTEVSGQCSRGVCCWGTMFLSQS
jgi:hypothetical protein